MQPQQGPGSSRDKRTTSNLVVLVAYVLNIAIPRSHRYFWMHVLLSGKAESRIVLASLYLGNGPKEDAIVDEIQRAMARSPGIKVSPGWTPALVVQSYQQNASNAVIEMYRKYSTLIVGTGNEKENMVRNNILFIPIAIVFVPWSSIISDHYFLSQSPLPTCSK